MSTVRVHKRREEEMLYTTHTVVRCVAGSMGHTRAPC